MHVHFRGGDTLTEANKNLLPLYMAHGITTVRDAGGDLTPAVYAWREQINAGKLAGPESSLRVLRLMVRAAHGRALWQ
ncbi:hypothetical protein H9L05_13170 [Hymenobacter qilianensis]|uniref:Dihydroorotase n=1 Tax=Hymenobacter qilianensis TaxID=1385715 RepID=A0A7H0GRZ8_9BACT|nr:hypothetical protein [Hymenobacter qilianensis]QNP51064.1 hypothetical protein H9L05_13170 [Hymenobacter qilianensis]